MQKHYPHSILSTYTNSSSSSFFLENRRISNRKTRNFFNLNLNSLKGKRRYENSAIEKESEFEVDPDKAREALRKLDQQLQSLSDKQIATPKLRVAASEVNLASRQRMSGEELDSAGAFLPYAALILLIFTIFYNVIFFKVIVPSIDGPQPKLSPPSVPMLIREEASDPQNRLTFLQ